MKTSIPRVLITFALVCFALVLKTQAVSPAPDGGYPGGNTAEGQNALFSLTTGGFNTGIGFLALRTNAAGQFNTAIGAGTLLANTGDSNTATGTGALLGNSVGSESTADGAFALSSNSIGGDNTAIGFYALFSNTTGGDNTAVGAGALFGNTTGFGNVALGMNAGTLVAVASNVICIGAAGQDVDNTTWISNIYATSTVSGTTLPVIVSDTGQLGTASSSRRFKKEIKPMESASKAILALKPVTFHYKNDTRNTPQFGLIAEEVAKVNPDLVVRDKEGRPYSVRYDQVNSMLLNEFLKEHRKTEKLEATVAVQQKQIEALTAGLQKVSARLDLTETSSRTVNNP